MAGGNVGGNSAQAGSEFYDPATGIWTTTFSLSLSTARFSHTATLLPSGDVLAAGGFDGSGLLASAEIYNRGGSRAFRVGIGTWTTTGSLATGRYGRTATLLSNGKVLVAGGIGGGYSSPFLTSAELYDPATGTWTATGSLQTARSGHTATLLPNGKVLVVGGRHNGTLTAMSELYEPASGVWTRTGPLPTTRYQHAATLLANGKVLVAGGDNGSDHSTSSASLYDPATGTWTTTGSLQVGRNAHTATLLTNGKVLVAGGRNDSIGFLISAELYDPVTGQWTTTGSLTVFHAFHTATLLPSGKVLVAGGNDSGDWLFSAELYDPATGIWTATGSLSGDFIFHTATLLPNGTVLCVKPGNEIGELYDPAKGLWNFTGPRTKRLADNTAHTATLLPNGKVLVVGSELGEAMAINQINELYDFGLGFAAAWRPQISALTPVLQAGSQLIVSGSGFTGTSEASGGTSYSSPTNYPLVQLRRLDNEQTWWLRPDPAQPFSAAAFTVVPLGELPNGHYLATVFANAIPSVSVFTRFGPAPSPPKKGVNIGALELLLLGD